MPEWWMSTDGGKEKAERLAYCVDEATRSGTCKLKAE
jgi:hypothetical protein